MPTLKTKKSFVERTKVQKLNSNNASLLAKRIGANIQNKIDYLERCISKLQSEVGLYEAAKLHFKKFNEPVLLRIIEKSDPDQPAMPELLLTIWKTCSK